MTGMVALYIFMLAAFTGYEVISRVPVILHTPLMSGSNFVHGIVLVGAMVALGNAHTPLEKSIGFIGVLLAAGNAVGGYVVTERMLEMFKSSRRGARRQEQRSALMPAMSASSRRSLIQASYFVTAALFILGTEAHELAGHARAAASSGPAPACWWRRWSPSLYPGMSNFPLIVAAIARRRRRSPGGAASASP